jgi:Holliday junction resolvase-like predicted endonuclease
MSDPRVGDPRLWHEDIPCLVAALNLEPYLYVYGPYNRYNLHKQGYMILGRDELIDVWDAVGGEVRAHMASYLGSVAGSVPADGEEFVSYLLGVEGNSWPLIPGPVAFRVNEEKLGLDFANITKRIFLLLEYPPVSGERANLRAGAFERATQDMIDGTRWTPPDSLSHYGGRHLRLGGVQIGEVDAIAEHDGTCILVSCKSRVYTADYDMGLHNVVRNTADYISRAVKDWEALVEKLRRNPVGDNYDLSAVRDLRGVVITPSVFYVPIGVAEKESVAGLKYYSSFGELEEWISRDGV